MEESLEILSMEQSSNTKEEEVEIFHSRTSLIEWTKDKGKQHGIIIVIKRSDSGESRKARIKFACERSGSYRQQMKTIEGKKRKIDRRTSTKKCGCPFLLSAQKLATADDWTLTVVCGFHNHSIAKHLEGHSFAGRLTLEETKILVDMSKCNIMPREILAVIKEKNKCNVSTIRTIYNARQKHRIREKAGRSQMQQLMRKLSEHNYIEWHRYEKDTNTVRDIFWAHPFGVDLLHIFPHVLVMDCTYKTNRYRLPLLEIVGVTSTEYTFSIAFVFLNSEQEDNYTWALDRLKTMMGIDFLPNVIVTDRELALINAIEKVFPAAKHLLCRYHISNNVLTKCRKKFESKEKWDNFLSDWNILTLSSSESEYNKRLKALEENYGRYSQAIDYVKDVWLNKYKEKFVSAWTNLVMHFGTTTTNRVESAHAKLKRYLRSSQGNFETSWSTIHNLLELQHTEIKASFEKSLTTVQHNFKPTLFKELRGFISRCALDKVFQESKRGDWVGFDIHACGCVIRRTHGLPCAHEINEYQLEGRAIPLACINSYWRKLDLVKSTKNEANEISCDAEIELFLRRFQEVDIPTKLHLQRKLRELAEPSTTFLVEPEVKMNTRGRPPSKFDHSTRQDPSAFEYVSAKYDKSFISSNLNTKNKDVRQNTSQHSQSYLKSLPCELKPYIRFVKDVESDGNCGFRAIADLMGMGEDSWMQVRKDLKSELVSHRNDYNLLYGCPDRVDELLHILSYFKSYPSFKYWMTMPDMGHIIASRYNIVLVHLSIQQCLTFFPLRSNPLPAILHKIITIGFVNNNHFIEVFMQHNSPIPPVATNWVRYLYSCAEGWQTPYEVRMRVFRDLVGKEVATQETINLDTP
ncbi:protein FAR1-RELATED SEQUENCE 6-like [Cannabis sativa]|uniref:protein FAR1-RELATED SEQUENCE 6-like n=1 Tax=Cannabis sativa TaxID=3483 RepID=UPI0029CA46DA|nr:protein FAR1-RELATED SEQUENCE 6-like [Cannabis sativa]